MQLLGWSIFATAVLHGGIAAYVSTLPAKAPPREATAITIREVAKKAEPPPKPVDEPPPVPPPVKEIAPEPKPAPPKPTPKPAAKPAAAEPAPASAPPPGPAAPADTGLVLGNRGGGNGAAVPAPGPAAPSEPAPKQPPKPKTLDAPKPAAGDGCAEPATKPRPLKIVQPAFTQEARDAAITGKVRVEITISAAGVVTNAKVIAGLGYGLDEAALEAAKASTFEPAQKCGVAVETTFTIGMRFQ